MITMDVKGITWVGHMYQQFENLFLEAEDVMYEDTVKYIEDQMQAVGESVKKLYSDIVGDLLPPNEKVGIELSIDKHAEAGLCKKPFQVCNKRHVKKPDTKHTIEDSRIDHGVDNVATLATPYNGTSNADAWFMSSLRSSVKEHNFSSPSRQFVERMDVKSNLRIDENPVSEKMAATKIIDGTTLAGINACMTSQSCEASNDNQNQNYGVARLNSETDFSNEIENDSTTQFPNYPVLVKLAGEKQIDTISSSCVSFEEPIEQGHKTMQQDHLKLEEACVMVDGDEIQLPPKASGNLNTNKKKSRQPFSLSKKSARKQEYKELAAWYLNSEKAKGDCMENFDPTLPQDHKKSLLGSMSEPEWELL
ncbi:hypothetical protein PHAVU_011G134500 [Phaseolus vulgaris]|uniref:Uncharacterized protein n=1 Tax=Phaseolus vulgaris TaxID=3885 RepID=V7AH55_PHAVU|nr:hypothetical protein PHAVU_011G134500g [Phaseolus vulgaris]ESW04894.1 hypothetical protein PHAVU_011G134500g [Phaseolus vulgaris]